MILAIQLALTVVTTPYSAKVFPLKPATIEGKMQCFSPNVARRTCKAITRYKAAGSNGYINTTMALIAEQPVTTMRTNIPVRVVNDAVCTTIQPSDISGATVTRDSVALSRDQARPILAGVATDMAVVTGRESCTRFAATASGFVAKVWVNGVYQPVLDQRFIWVGSNEGFNVVP